MKMFDFSEWTLEELEAEQLRLFKQSERMLDGRIVIVCLLPFFVALIGQIIQG